MLSRVVAKLVRVALVALAMSRLRLPFRWLPGFRGRPLLSVVMPVYNVELYVGDAIASVLRQSYRNLELIIVDDGSPDGSTPIARGAARRDPRVRYLRTENAGLGAARNRGAALARGEYLAFFDSDDIVPPRAYERLVGSLERTGSDLATGNVTRFQKGRAAHPSWNQHASHATDRPRTTLSEHPLLVRDTTAWNKVFRASYARQIALAFPEGRLYEDMVPITRALRDASSIDVLSEVTYRWRVREEVGSITQRRFEVANVTDKVEMLIGCLDLVEDDPRLREALVLKAFEADLWAYAPHVGEGDTAFDAAFDRGISRFWEPGLLDRLELSTFVRYVFYGSYAAVGPERARESLAWTSQGWQTIPTRCEDGRVRIVPPTDPDLTALPASSLDLTRFIDVQSCVTQVHWVEDHLRVRGFGYLPQVSDAIDQSLALCLISDHGERVDLDVVRRSEPLAPLATRCPFYDLTGAGFEITIDPAALSDGVWGLSITASALGIERTRDVRAARMDGSAGSIEARMIAGRAVALHIADQTPFEVVLGAFATAEPVPPEPCIEIETVEVLDAPGLRMTGSMPPGAAATTLRLEDPAGIVAAVPLGPDVSFDVVLTLSAPGGDGIVRPVPSGTYAVSSDTGVVVRASQAAATAWPALIETPDLTVSLQRGPQGSVEVVVTGPSSDRDRGAYRQRLLAERWWRGLGGSEARSETVFVSSFGGASVSCHPGAIGGELVRRGFAGDVLAEVTDRSVPVPDGFIPVVRGSEDWHRALGTSRWVIANTSFETEVAVSDDQTYLQTWHGTPLKRIGRDIPFGTIPRVWLDRAAREARHAWTQLLSTSPFTSEILPRALEYTGPLLEAGSPRLDRLVADPSYARAAVRELYGIPDDHAIVLYAPTWREGGRASELLDADEFARRFGDRATLIVRAHPNLLGRRAKKNLGSSAVRDAARYPVIEDLYSAADVMVTDYSSAMFDFAATRRPQIMFTPDLGAYRDGVRGFYLDFDAWAPGPIVRSTAEVLGLLEDVPALAASSEDRRTRFAERFLPWEDGRASARVIAALGIEVPRL